MKFLDSLGLTRFLTNCDNRFAKKDHIHDGAGGGGLTPVEFVRIDMGDPTTYIYDVPGAGLYTAILIAVDASGNEVTTEYGTYVRCTCQLLLEDVSDIEQIGSQCNYDCSHPSFVDAAKRYPYLMGMRVGDSMPDMPSMQGKYLICPSQLQTSSTSSNGTNFTIHKLYKQEVIS